MLVVRCKTFTLRCSLYVTGNVLLTSTSMLFPPRLLFGSCFSLGGPLLSRCSPLIVHRLSAQCLLHAIAYYLLAAPGPIFAFFLYSTRRSTNRRALLAVSSGGLLRATHFLKLASLSLNVGCSPLSTTLASLCSQLVTRL